MSACHAAVAAYVPAIIVAVSTVAGAIVGTVAYLAGRRGR